MIFKLRTPNSNLSKEALPRFSTQNPEPEILNFEPVCRRAGFKLVTEIWIG
jgi:hypothetical protein